MFFDYESCFVLDLHALSRIFHVVVHEFKKDNRKIFHSNCACFCVERRNKIKQYTLQKSALTWLVVKPTRQPNNSEILIMILV